MSRLTPQQRWKLFALKNAQTDELIKEAIRQRWSLPNWDISFPWWREPSRVRILMYAEGRITFKDGPFRGMRYVTTLLRSRPYFFVDFEITTAHRTSPNAGACIPGRRQLDDPELEILKRFDQIWFFGFSERSSLTVAERDLLNTFMCAPYYGGVLVTGDHRDRGKSIAGNIPRARKMRSYPSPDALERVWNNSLVEGTDPNCVFDPNDQSDDVPQIMRLELFPTPSLPRSKPLYRPHPVLCSQQGPIDVLPDHQHEGEAVAPTITSGDKEWPEKNGHQERPVIIARGKTKEPNSGDREFGVLSAYDGHNVGVGRIVADSSWHHWFDANITGIEESDFYHGFGASPEGRKALKKIDAFFLNCGAWLAPPTKQNEMRHAAWWSILWTGEITELSPDLPLRQLGKQAVSALKLYASDCAASDWIFGIPTVKQWLSKTDFGQTSKHLTELNVSLEQYLAGGILKSLLTEIGPFNDEIEFPFEAPADGVLESLIERGIDEALSSIK